MTDNTKAIKSVDTRRVATKSVFADAKIAAPDIHNNAGVKGQNVSHDAKTNGSKAGSQLKKS